MSSPGWRRDRFVLPDGLIYLDGNSLGALPRIVSPRLTEAIEQEWGQGLIGSWNQVPGGGPGSGWIDIVDRCAQRLAPLLGVGATDIHVGESTSQTLFATTVAAVRARPGRRALVIDRTTFPTDAYVIASVARLLDLEVRWCDGPGADGGVSAVEAVLDDDVALVSLTHVDFRTGAMFDLPAVTAAVRASGALMQWDLCHSTGAVPVELAAAGADFAVGCTYKYLNAGPGSPAYAWVAPHLQADLDPPVAGWMGHSEPFAMRLEHDPRPGAARLRVGTPPVLALSSLEAALGVFEGVSQAELRAASLSLTDRFLHHLDALTEQHPTEQITVVTPREHARRGSQVSFRHVGAYGVVQALIARGVVGDFRDPDIARFGFAPLYTTLDDVDRAAQALDEVLASRAYADPAYAVRNSVT